MGADHDEAPWGASEETGQDQNPFLKNGTANDESVISVVPSGFGYNYGNRPHRDRAFSKAFFSFVALSLGVGIFAAFNGSSDYRSVGSASYDSSRGCKLLKGSKDDVEPLFSWDALPTSLPFSVKILSYVIMATVSLMVPVGLGLLWVLRKYTKELVYATLPFYFIIPTASVFIFYVYCNMTEECVKRYDPTTLYLFLGFVLFAYAFYFWFLYRNWARVELAIRLIRTASEALHQNLGLLLLLPALNVAYLVFYVPFAFGLFFAFTNGKIVANPDLYRGPQRNCGGEYDLPCCEWQTDAWVPAYFVLTIFVVLWGVCISNEIHDFTVSGTISQWYFSPPASSTVGTTKRSLSHALGPSFGTVCFSGLVITFVRIIRRAIDSSRSTRGAIGFVALILRACLSCLLSSVEYLTEFTTCFAAITGEGFCASAVMTSDLLRRNFLSTLMVEFLTERLLVQTIPVVAAVYGFLVWGVLALFVPDGKGLWTFAVLAWYILLLYLMSFAHVLHKVVNAVYICFAMDKDHNEVSKPEVHDSYVLLPTADDGTASLAVSMSSTKS